MFKLQLHLDHMCIQASRKYTPVPAFASTSFTKPLQAVGYLINTVDRHCFKIAISSAPSKVF